MSDRIVSDAGLPSDHAAFKAMVEIEMIAKLATRTFDGLLPSGMTRAQFGVLNRLARLDARETISELADIFGVSQPTMSSTVKKLLDKRLVRTEGSAYDGRRKVVRLTEAGTDLRGRVTQSLEPLFAEVEAQHDLLDWDALLDQLALVRAAFEAR